MLARMASPYEPKILGLLCNWCSYSAADLAGASRFEYPANIRVVRVMCTGRIDPTFILQAFAGGADGVLVCGCHPGDCHYLTGNIKAAARLQIVQRLLVDFGIEPQRFRVEWVSAQEAERYRELVKEMTAALAPLGPLQWPAMVAARSSLEA